MQVKIFTNVIAAALIPSVVLFALFAFDIKKVGAASDTFTSSGVWVAPSGVTSINVDAWGAGGGGANVAGNSRGGGGGGAYAGLINFAVTPGNSYIVTVGIAGAVNTNGGTTTFSASSTLTAAPGWSAPTASGKGLGGAIASSTGDVLHAGGDGGSSSSGLGGSGGGAGGTTANGSSGTTSNISCANGVGGAGGASGGGAGGDSNTNPHTAGTAPGGGGAGSSNGANCDSLGASVGARGEVVITYVVSTVTPQTTSIITVTGGTASLTNGTITF